MQVRCHSARAGCVLLVFELQQLAIRLGCGLAVDLADRRKLEFSKEPVEFRAHCAETGVGPQTREDSASQPRLVEIEFPRVKVNAGWLMLFLVDAPESSSGVPD